MTVPPTRSSVVAPIERVGVVVPAADEQDRIGACLDGLLVATADLGRQRPDVAVDLVVVLDGCTDRTAAIVAERVEVRRLAVDARCVGAARAAGCQVLPVADPRRTWTAHTDADSVVPPNWLTHMVTLADAGADLVLGTVWPDGELPASGLATWRALHTAGDDHPHIHGANLGIRTSTLSHLGGWPRLTTGEDVELAARAARAEVATVRTGAIPVRTSGRSVGRAPDGFAHYLQDLVPDLR